MGWLGHTCTIGSVEYVPDVSDAEEDVIQQVRDTSNEPLAGILACEAAQVAEQLWASGVASLIARDEIQVSRPNPFLLLTFGRLTHELELALLASPPAVAI